MSVQNNQYIAFGYLLSYKEAKSFLLERMSEDEYENVCDTYYDNAFQSKVTEINGCSMIWDGMGGDYMFFGKIFAKSKDEDSLDTMEIPIVSSKTKKNTQNEFARLFGEKISQEKQAKLYFINHYR